MIAKATVDNKDDVIVINEAVTLSNVINYQLGRKVRITNFQKVFKIVNTTLTANKTAKFISVLRTYVEHYLRKICLYY